MVLNLKPLYDMFRKVNLTKLKEHGLFGVLTSLVVIAYVITLENSLVNVWDLLNMVEIMIS